MKKIETKQGLRKLIDVAAGRAKADIVIKNGRVIDVFGGKILPVNIAICDGKIAGLGDYEGEVEYDAEGCYIAPGFIDCHIHIESSYVSPEEEGRLLVPHGGTTIIADPHEIVNVCGLKGLEYMIQAGKMTKMDIKYMLPSCVPATHFENAGAVIDADQMRKALEDYDVLGLGEFMDYVGVVGNKEESIDKLSVAAQQGRIVDGHAPALRGYSRKSPFRAGN